MTTGELQRARFIRKGWLVSAHCFPNHYQFPGYWKASAHLARPKSRIKTGMLAETRELAIKSLMRECEKWEKRWDKIGYNWRGE